MTEKSMEPAEATAGILIGKYSLAERYRIKVKDMAIVVKNG